MESENGIEEAELVNDSTENAPEKANGSGKENEATNNGATLVQANEASEDITVDAETLDPPEAGDEGAVAATDSKASNATKKAGSGGDNRLKKVTKDRIGQPDIIETKKKRPVLSQSLSFPSKASGASSVRTNTTSIRQSKVASTLANGDPSSKQRLTSASSIRRSLPVKTGSIDVTGNGTYVDRQSNDAKKLSRHSLPVKVDDDSFSNASSSTPGARRSTGSGFNFRLDERAEKRKEFFMKLEEKIQAKEVEKTNLQEKSKEYQEAEIKQLRKNLTFKATPMPSFYKEPGPPKVELKKIPPTRAKSPKLGRRKPSGPAVENSSESGSPRLTPGSAKLKEIPSNDKGTLVAASKNSSQKSISKLPSQKSKATKMESPATSRKSSNLESDKVKARGNDSEAMNASAKQNAVVVVETDSLDNRVEEEDESLDNLNGLGISPPEVPVQG